MIRQTFSVGPLACNCTIIANEANGEAIVVDGGDGIDDVIARLNSNGWRAKFLVHTHAHIDHIGDLGRLRELAGGAALLHPGDLPLYKTLALQARWIGIANVPPVVALDGELHDGDVLQLGDVRCRVLHTPGHTPGSVSFEVADHESLALLTGDTLFAGAIGRWDLGGTSMDDIVHSIRTKLMDHDDDTPVVPGHGPFTTIGIERNSNPYLIDV
ncbi:MAG TPA: MBL fold metallo-hydrolase [Candidatus Cybelea sp.]